MIVVLIGILLTIVFGVCVYLSISSLRATELSLKESNETEILRTINKIEKAKKIIKASEVLKSYLNMTIDQIRAAKADALGESESDDEE